MLYLDIIYYSKRCLKMYKQKKGGGGIFISSLKCMYGATV